MDQNPTEVFATFKINAPANMQTKATNSGTAEETAVKTLHVFIYDVASPHAPTIASFSTDANTLINSGNSWTASTPIRTLKADKYIFAGINLTPAIINEITSRGLGAFSYKEFEQSISDLTNPTDGFVMFNTTYPAVTPGDALATSAEAAKANPISIPVSRVVAKAAVVKSTSFVVNGGGTMQNITYGWRNINRRFYFIPKIDGGIIKDYNWDSYNVNDFVRGTDQIPVNEATATPTTFSYALENSFNYIPGSSLVDQTTFLSIQGQFLPTQICRIKTGVTAPQGATDFEFVNNPNGYGTFYVVRTDDGSSNYFITGTDAEKYAELCIAHAPDMPALTGGYSLSDNTFTNGMCYFHVLVNSAASGQYGPYGIYRNQYYRMTLNSIQAPGNPNDNFDHNQVISPNTWVDVNITVDEWQEIDEDCDL
ncbi:Mfa1 family fimbria major subunit [Odoribacter splanchnicus]|uniref:Mfa1 family fimbria major subunit n=1 Tax=Odoribacter splanchnicus TaxID=28118 RepID=A0AAW5CDS3_9BACT|nr:Mfa1 family fimbria major subunit [Odoribacter splanchnicus]MCG5002935.1 Mfa1 family fimbria major subunit [Odoribacter splanchnicus]